MTTRVRAVYDFSGEPATSELSIVSGEILILTRTDVGEGWWEGTNAKGQTGLFPEAYVEIFKETQAVAAPPSVVQQRYEAPAGQQRYDAPDDFGDQQDEWDDDWDDRDDDNETYSEIGPPNNQVRHSASQQQMNNYSNVNLPPAPADDTISMTSTSAPLKKSGIFAKSGDSYILGTTTVSVPDNERTFILNTEHGYFWKQIRDPYTVRVASPKKETKFKGMKSFIAYQLTPSFNNIAVSRRYKHFDWLHERLVDKFCLIPIPPLPDKQISGRYEDEFIGKIACLRCDNSEPL